MPYILPSMMCTLANWLIDIVDQLAQELILAESVDPRKTAIKSGILMIAPWDQVKGCPKLSR